MGGCFSGQKGLESSENTPVQAPVSPKAVETTVEPATTATAAENIETPKEEEPLIDVSEAKEEEVKEDVEVVPKEAVVTEAVTVVEAEPVQVVPAADEKADVEEEAPEAVTDVVKEAKVAEVAVSSSGSEGQTSAAPVTL